MSKPNKDGWIRHRGGKCPVDGDAKVDYRMRDGEIMTQPAGRLAWSHNSDIGDIMAYRIHKPAEQPAPVSEPVERKCEGRACEMPDAESHSKECLLDAAIDQGWAGPLQWRDRITEIYRTVEALEEERVALVQWLEAEGFRLIERAVQPAVDMSDWRNWEAGDVLEYVGENDTKYYTRGAKYKIFRFEPGSKEASPIFDDNSGYHDHHWAYDEDLTANFKFHSRPSK